MSEHAAEDAQFSCEAWKHEGERPCPSCTSVGYCQASDGPVPTPPGAPQ